MNKYLFFLLVLLSQQVYSQSEKFELKGSFEPNPETKKPVTFTLSWEEKDGKMNGTYDDNFYGQKVPVKGIASDTHGRILIGTFPKESKGIRTITFLGSDLKGTKGAALLPFSVVLRDENGKPVNTTQIDANLIAIAPPAPAPAATSTTQTPQVAQRQETPPCQEGFGSMAGFCGVYNGMLTEEEDNEKKCNLLSYKTSHLVLDDNAEMGISLGDVSDIISTPVHRIGRLPASPENTDVDLMSRVCRPLPGIAFKGDNCKRLALIGSFTINGKNKHFTGTYTIVDENTNQSCRYSISMDQPI